MVLTSLALNRILDGFGFEGIRIDVAVNLAEKPKNCQSIYVSVTGMTAGVMWRLCGFYGAKSTAKKTRGLLSLEWDESKEIRCHQGGLFYNSRPIRH